MGSLGEVVTSVSASSADIHVSSDHVRDAGYYLKIKDDLINLRRNTGSSHMTMLFTRSNLLHAIEAIEVKLQKKKEGD